MGSGGGATIISELRSYFPILLSPYQIYSRELLGDD